MASDPLAEIREGFFAECEELLESLQDSLALLGPGLPETETINTVFRAVHSIKGGAGAFGLTDLVDFSHRYESVLGVAREGKLELTDAILKLMVQAADLLQDLVRAAHEDAPPPDGTAQCLRALEELTSPPQEEEEFFFQPVALIMDFDDAPASGGPWKVCFRPASGFYETGNEALYLLRALAELGAEADRTAPGRSDLTRIVCDFTALPKLADLDPQTPCLTWTITLPSEVSESDIREIFDFVEDLCDLAISTEAIDAEPEPVFTKPVAIIESPPPADAPAAIVQEAKPAKVAAAAPVAAPTVRVDLDRIDRLVNLVGELVINQAMLAQSVTEAGLHTNSTVMTGLEAFTSLTREIQDSVMLIRAQPVKPLFQRMARIVREVSASTGKDVNLVTVGEMTEVDRTVIERLAEPLTHMIRNAVDHGLEMPDRRRAAGKAEQGEILLSAQHRAGRLVVELSDDGAGIDRQKVRDTAITRGLVTPDAVLSDQDIDNLLFMPGFSTASTLSAVSGRGVGMDVVRPAIHGLGGRVSIDSTPGDGTKFTISLPLTLAVLDGMVVSVCGETLVVPLSAILETATLDTADIRNLGQGLQVLQMRGTFMPLIDLGVELGFNPHRTEDCDRLILLTAQESGAPAAMIVDAIIEQRQVVIKGLHQIYGRIPGIAAATILGDGRIALIIDPADLVEHSSRPPPCDLAMTG